MPLASTRQHTRKPKGKKRPAIRRSARWRAKCALSMLSLLAPLLSMHSLQLAISTAVTDEEPSHLNPRGGLGCFAARAAAKRVALWMVAISARPATETNEKNIASPGVTRAHGFACSGPRRDARGGGGPKRSLPSSTRAGLSGGSRRAPRPKGSLFGCSPSRLAPRPKRTENKQGHARTRFYVVCGTAATLAARVYGPTRSLPTSIREAFSGGSRRAPRPTVALWMFALGSPRG